MQRNTERSGTVATVAVVGKHIERCQKRILVRAVAVVTSHRHIVDAGYIDAQRNRIAAAVAVADDDLEAVRTEVVGVRQVGYGCRAGSRARDRGAAVARAGRAPAEGIAVDVACAHVARRKAEGDRETVFTHRDHLEFSLVDFRWVVDRVDSHRDSSDGGDVTVSYRVGEFIGTVCVGHQCVIDFVAIDNHATDGGIVTSDLVETH